MMRSWSTAARSLVGSLVVIASACSSRAVQPRTPPATQTSVATVAQEVPVSFQAPEAWSDFQHGNPRGAEQIARRMLGAAPRDAAWDYGNAVYLAHIIIGHVDLHRGDVRAAVDELLAAGKTPGSPQLDSFGPNMTLAQALLTHGNRDAVLEFFDECRTFWTRGKSNLDEWTTDVRQGRTPVFGANLNYGLNA